MLGRRKRASGRLGSFRLYVDVLGLEHLHYGLWDGDPFTLDGFKAAQERFTNHLIDLIGPEVRSVLDCGCGIGATALKLRERGFEVEGLTPDPFQHEKFEVRTGLTCHLARFEEFRPPHRYDLVLMSESCRCIPVDRLFSAVRKAAPGGRWLLGDYFSLYKDGSILSKSGPLLEQFLAESRRAGLVLEYEKDITDQVTPTLDLARITVDEKVLPAARNLGEWLADRYWPFYTPLFKIARFLLRKQISHAEAQRVLIDGDAFRKAKRYMIYRFQVPD